MTAVGVVMVPSLAYLLDRIWPSFSDQLPITANVLAGAALVPAEIFVVYGIVDRLLARRQKQRWATVAAELVEAIGAKWSELRELLVGLPRFDNGHDRDTDPEVVIRAAEEVWYALHLQDEAQPDEIRGTADARWDLPDGCDEVLAEVAGIWLQLWPAGLTSERTALQRRLTNVLLPRLATDDPDLTSAARLFVDAINDLDDLLLSLKEIEDPFPVSPYWNPPNDESGSSDIAAKPVIPSGSPAFALSNLRELRRSLAAIDKVIDRGDQLIALLNNRRGQEEWKPR